MVSPVFIRSLLAILVTTAFIGIVAVILRNGSHNQLPAQSALRQLPQNIDIALKKARFSEIRDGSVVWELVAERVDYDKSGEVAHLGGIKMDFVRNRSAGSITVTADRGDYFSNNRDVLLRGNVHVETEDGISFDTDSIDYKALKSQFKTAEKVEFSQQRLALTAVGMEMDVKSQQARFFKLVDATVAGMSMNGSGLRSASESAKVPLANTVTENPKGKKR